MQSELLVSSGLPISRSKVLDDEWPEGRGEITDALSEARDTVAASRLVRTHPGGELTKFRAERAGRGRLLDQRAELEPALVREDVDVDPGRATSGAIDATAYGCGARRLNASRVVLRSAMASSSCRP